MLLPLVAAALVALAFVLRARAGRESPDGLERAFLLAAALPLVLALVLPIVVSLAFGFDGHTRGLINRASAAGVVLSAALFAIGLGLIVRARRQRRGWGWPLGGAVLVAAVPAIVAAVTYALFTFASALVR
jgi:hypothetical protein